MTKARAAEQFAALGLTDQSAWTKPMTVAVKQRWTDLPVDVKTPELRARLAAVAPAPVTRAAAMKGLAEAGVVAPDTVVVDVEMKRLKRNAAVNAWRERNQLQAAIDARGLVMAARTKRAPKVEAAPAAMGAAS